jgi:Domain of unknown function (DUF222)/HNH endonuclease
MLETPGDVGDLNLIGAAASLSDEEITSCLDGLFRQKAAVEGAIVVLMGEVERRQVYRGDGATGPEPWAVERFGVSVPTARAYARVGERAWDLPHLTEALCLGEVSFDKVRAVADVAGPESDQALSEAAKECTVRQLADLALAGAPTRKAGAGGVPERRRSLRCNDALGTINVQLPPAPYAEARACLEARARSFGSDGETPYDERLCDAFLDLVRGERGGDRASDDDRDTKPAPSPYVVVVHVPLASVLEDQGEPSALGGELERAGLISTQAVRQVACDATVVLALDDDVGHTMYEGRARRVPSETQRREVARRDRHCRFPGCVNATFTNVHHIVAWKPGGRTDLDNLALLCVHHHHLVHSRGWEMSGNANEELRFAGPSGRVMTTRPSPLWKRVTKGAPG